MGSSKISITGVFLVGFLSELPGLVLVFAEGFLSGMMAAYLVSVGVATL